MLLGSVLGACAYPPPVDLQPALVASPALAVVRPVDIAILPVQDATVAGVFAKHRRTMRDRLGFALAHRAYSPLAASHTDARVTGDQMQRGSAVDAAFVRALAGSCEGDAVLGVRVTRWDERALMSRQSRVHFACEVLLVAADGTVLWSGRLDGSVKPGGENPAPLRREDRSRSAVQIFADALIGELPARRRG